MADNILYRDAIVVTTVKKTGDEKMPSFVLDLPFLIFGQDVIQDGVIVTYSLADHVGEEVMAKVDYKVEDESLVHSFSGWLGADPKSASTYETHYPQAFTLPTKSLGTKILNVIGLGDQTEPIQSLAPIKFCMALCLEDKEVI